MTNVSSGGRLTTHVLDTATGRPAAGVALALHAIGPDGAATLVAHRLTNADGRCDEPLLAGDAIKPGVYEIVFEIGDYFRKTGAALAEPAFLDRVPIRFGIADAGAHYHVPLLVSPYGFSTYRGS